MRPPGTSRWVHVVWICALAACAGRSGQGHHPAAGSLGPYSGAVEAGGLVFVSGRIGERGGSFEREVETAIDAVEAQLVELGLGLADVVAATVYLTDLGRYAELNAIYARRFPAPYPARACVEVAALPGDARVELVVTAQR